jgi:hypothetical protein
MKQRCISYGLTNVFKPKETSKITVVTGSKLNEWGIPEQYKKRRQQEFLK